MSLFYFCPNFRKKNGRSDAQEIIFDDLLGVWKANQTLFPEFNITSQSKLKL